MLDVLLESRAPRARRMRITIASALAHAALIAGAVSLTTAGPAKATAALWADTLVFVAPPPPLDRPATPRGGPTPEDWHEAPTAPAIPPIPDLGDVARPSYDVGATPSTGPTFVGSGIPTELPFGNGPLIGAGGSPVDEHLVDHAPRLLDPASAPNYPASLRAAGVEGRVVVQFVVDTLGRAELNDLQVVESPHPLFVEAVRASLARYRFTVGEAGGRKVRTRVQIPFEFTLVR